jgi:transcriptional regulator with XRE-family HTH domain
MFERDLDMKELSLLAGLGETAVRDALKRTGDVKASTLQAIADALGMSLAELYEGDETLFQRIPVVGYLTAHEEWKEREAREPIDLHIEGEALAIEVRDNSLAPVYRNGDMLIGVIRKGGRYDNYVGLDCIVKTAEGERYIKYLARGTMRGRFNLRSYDASQKDVENAHLEWVAPIAWIRRFRG